MVDKYIKEVEHYNQQELDRVSKLPGFVDILLYVKPEDRLGLISQLFYIQFQPVKKKGKKKDTFEFKTVQCFADDRISKIIKKLQYTYCNNKPVVSSDSYQGTRVGVTGSTQQLRPEEIWDIFSEFIVKFAKREFNSQGVNKKHFTNKIYNYIYVSLNGLILNKLKKQKKDINIIFIENIKITGTQEEPLDFNDIIAVDNSSFVNNTKPYKDRYLDREAFKATYGRYPNKEELDKWVKLLDKREAEEIKKCEGELLFLDFCGEHENESNNNVIKQWRKVVTKKQKKHMLKLLKSIKDGQDIFDWKKPTEFKFSEVSKILYPKMDSSEAYTATVGLLNRINDRMDKALQDKAKG